MNDGNKSDLNEDQMSDESEESSGSSSDEGGHEDEAVTASTSTGNVIDEELDGTGNVIRTTAYKTKDGTEKVSLLVADRRQFRMCVNFQRTLFPELKSV